MNDGDIVVRLRQFADEASGTDAVMFGQAIDEIERLRGLLSRLRSMIAKLLQNLEGGEEPPDEGT